MKIIRQDSPNFGPRRGGARPELVVLHYTAMPSTEAALARLCDPSHEVSAHYLISAQGDVVQLVDETMRAWHAGAGSWAGRGDVNSRSVGIELANSGFAPFCEAQMAALETLLSDVMARWSIPPEALIGHSDMAPTRKSDPGARFDWHRLARQGLSVWPRASGQPPNDVGFLRAAEQFGYPVEYGQEATLAAFRRRFRPWAKGAVTGEDVAAVCDLAARFPVDGADGLA